MDEVLAGFRAMDACTISDALDALDLQVAQPTGISPMWEGARAIGRALTVQLEPAPPPPSHESVHLGARAIAAGTNDNVIVVANAGRIAMGAWGGLLSAAAASRRIAGVVVDGACRDVDQAREGAFPIFAIAPVVRTARGRVFEAAFNVEIELGGAVVRPGDIVCADASGVVVIPQAFERKVLAKAQDITTREEAMLRAIASGDDVRAVLGGAYEHMLEGDVGPAGR